MKLIRIIKRIISEPSPADHYFCKVLGTILIGHGSFVIAIIREIIMPRMIESIN